MKCLNVKFIYPPIPVRSYDWQATIDGDEPDENGWGGPYGQGETKEQAVIDMFETIFEDVRTEELSALAEALEETMGEALGDHEDTVECRVGYKRAVTQLRKMLGVSQ